MPLYGKLLAIVMMAAGVQWSIQNRQHGRDAWFALRCQVAHVTGDAELLEQLIRQAGRDMDAARESERVMNASGGG